jgi:hypothetical protein
MESSALRIVTTALTGRLEALSGAIRTHGS